MSGRREERPGTLAAAGHKRIDLFVLPLEIPPDSICNIGITTVRDRNYHDVGPLRFQLAAGNDQVVTGDVPHIAIEENDIGLQRRAEGISGRLDSRAL